MTDAPSTAAPDDGFAGLRARAVQVLGFDVLALVEAVAAEAAKDRAGACTLEKRFATLEREVARFQRERTAGR